jgi:hypothetical protein
MFLTSNPITYESKIEYITLIYNATYVARSTFSVKYYSFP